MSDGLDFDRDRDLMEVPDPLARDPTLDLMPSADGSLRRLPSLRHASSGRSSRVVTHHTAAAAEPVPLSSTNAGGHDADSDTSEQAPGSSADLPRWKRLMLYLWARVRNLPITDFYMYMWRTNRT